MHMTREQDRTVSTEVSHECRKECQCLRINQVTDPLEGHSDRQTGRLPILYGGNVRWIFLKLLRNDFAKSIPEQGLVINECYYFCVRSFGYIEGILATWQILNKCGIEIGRVQNQGHQFLASPTRIRIRFVKSIDHDDLELLKYQPDPRFRFMLKTCIAFFSFRVTDLIRSLPRNSTIHHASQ